MFSSVTEQPYKIPHYAALLRSLDEVKEETDSLLRVQVLEDLWKGFQSFLDKLAWREIRLCVCFPGILYLKLFLTFG